MQHLISPHGGELIDLLAKPERIGALRAASREWPSWDLTPRQLCELELLLNGGFSPLRGFMSRVEYESACCQMRLSDRTLWPIPITLDVSEELARSIGPGSMLALRDAEGTMLAALQVEEVWKPDRLGEDQQEDGTTSCEHPGVEDLLQGTHPWCVGGRLVGVHLPRHYGLRA